MKNQKKKKELNSLNLQLKPPFKIRIKEHLKHSSLFIFHKDWKFTKFIKQISNSTEFNYIMFIIIIISIIVIAFDNAWVRPNSVQYTTINISNYFINICFIIEGLMKIISDGFLFREKVNEKLSIKGDEFFNQILAQFIIFKNKKLI